MPTEVFLEAYFHLSYISDEFKNLSDGTYMIMTGNSIHTKKLLQVDWSDIVIILGFVMQITTQTSVIVFKKLDFLLKKRDLQVLIL